MMQLNLPYLLATAATRRACMVHQRSGVVRCERLGAFRGGVRASLPSLCGVFMQGPVVALRTYAPMPAHLAGLRVAPHARAGCEASARYRCGLCLALGRNAAMVRGRLFAGQGGGTGACMGTGGD